MTGLLMVRREYPLQSRFSQGYLIVNARQISYPSGGPDHGSDLSSLSRSSYVSGTWPEVYSGC